MAEGRTNAYYVSDILKTAKTSDGTPTPAAFKTSVPNNLEGQASLGWATSVPGTAPPGLRLPKRLKPRHAVGVSPAGKRVKVIIATTSASLWGNATGTWTYIDNFGATITATVTGFVGESTSV